MFISTANELKFSGYSWNNTNLAATFLPHIRYISFLNIDGRDSAVSVVTCYGMDCPRIKSRLGRDFPRPSRPAVGHTQLPIQWVPGIFPGGKVAGAWR